MSLENIVKEEIKVHGNSAGVLKNLIERIESKEGVTESGIFNLSKDRELITLILSYSIPEGQELSEDQIEALKELNSDELTKVLVKYLPRAYEGASKKVKEKITGNEEEIINELKGTELLEVLVETPYSKKEEDAKFKNIIEDENKYYEWNSKYNSGELEYYIENSHPIIKEIFERINDKRKNEKIKEYMKKRVDYHKLRYILNFVKDKDEYIKGNKEKDKSKIDNSLNNNLLKEYLEFHINNSEDKKEEIYGGLGIVYSSHLIEKEREKNKEEVKKEYNNA